MQQPGQTGMFWWSYLYQEAVFIDRTYLVVVQIAYVDDDDADEYFERYAGYEHRQHEVVEPMSLATNVQQQFEFCDLC